MSKVIQEAIKRENEVIGNLKAKFIAHNPRFQQNVSISPAEVSGSIASAYHRGLAIGGEDGMEMMAAFVKKKHPELFPFIEEMKEFIKANKINID